MSDPSEPLFSIRRLCVSYGEYSVVENVSLHVDAGEVVALVGESGSGKTQTLYAALGLLGDNARVVGSVRFRGRELRGMSPAQLRRLRGDRITLVFQEPATALDPLVRVGDQIAAVIAAHGDRPGRHRIGELLEEVGVAGGADRAGAFPHQLSGGERQRVMIAMAIANRPDLLIADEPTTSLDPTVQKRILDNLEERRRARGLAMILVTHDLRLARRYAHRTYVMRKGRVVEDGTTSRLFASPRHAYTKMLIGAAPMRESPRRVDNPIEVLACENLKVSYGRKLAIDGVTLTLRRGRTLAVVGESGSGKSTLARALLRLQPSIGEVRWSGESVTRLEGAALRRARTSTQIVFQDPYAALSPRLSVRDIVVEGLRAQGRSTAGAAEQALVRVGLDPKLSDRLPSALSGGQRQRVAIARSVAVNPAALVLDEPTSSLDRAAQRDVVELLGQLQAVAGVAFLLITHDFDLARSFADEILVLRGGRAVEYGSAREVFDHPAHPYTRALIDAADLTT